MKYCLTGVKRNQRSKMQAFFLRPISLIFTFTKNEVSHFLNVEDTMLQNMAQTDEAL